jgi:histidinol-phosphate aminotransferase
MKALINPNILELTPYKPGKPAEEIRRRFNLKKVIKLASNENPSPVPAHVSEAIHREISNIHSYPDSDSYYLINRIAQYNGVDAENIVVGSGSVEIIRMIVKSFLNPGEKVLTSEKTFLLYKIATIETAGKSAFVEAPMNADYRIDLDKMVRLVDEKTKIIFIANPNNPTGTTLPKRKLMDFIDKIPEDKIIVLDNAYQEYVNHMEDYVDGIEMAVNRKNIVVLRTFSKIYSLAGLRIGYGISNKAVISYLARIKAPFNVTRIGQTAALASLRDDEFKNKSAALNVKNREKLFQQLTQIGLKVIPSVTNFILFFPGIDITVLNNHLLKEGVIIRPLQAFGVPDGMRVTVGFEEDNDFFVEKLKKVLDEIK